jgi:hypothetical protein
MTTFHRLKCTASPGGLLFTCEDDECGRRLIVDPTGGGLVVIDHGDRAALHRGSVGGVELSAARVGPA